MHQGAAAAAAAKSLQLRRPWDSPGKNTGVGCHLVLTVHSIQA